MSKLRVIAIVAILALSTVAIGKALATNNKVITTFYYVGPTQNPQQSDFNSPENYTADKPDGLECGGKEMICSLKDNPSTSDPDQPALDLGTVTNTPGGVYQITQRDLN